MVLAVAQDLAVVLDPAVGLAGALAAGVPAGVLVEAQAVALA